VEWGRGVWGARAGRGRVEDVDVFAVSAGLRTSGSGWAVKTTVSRDAETAAGRAGPAEELGVVCGEVVGCFLHYTV
jgi:hypothetical protein